MKLLVFAGSTRQNSFNRRLARVAAGLARDAGAEATLLELSDFDIPMYNADLEARGTPSDVLRLKQLMWEHPAWIICSPEYNGSYTALLKHHRLGIQPRAHRPGLGRWHQVLSRQGGRHAQCVERRAGRPALPKPSGAAAHHPGMLAGPRAFALNQAANAFDAGGALVQEAHRLRVHGVIEQVLWAAQRLDAA